MPSPGSWAIAHAPLRRSQRTVAAGEEARALEGIPFAVKDVIDVGWIPHDDGVERQQWTRPECIGSGGESLGARRWDCRW